MESRPPLRLVLLLGALSTFGPLSMDLYLPGLPAMAHDLDAVPSAAQLTMTACMVGLAAGQLVLGPISDQLGRRRPLLAGLAAYALASLLCALAPTIWTLLAVRLVQGLAGATGIVIAGAIVRDLSGGPASARLYAALMTVSSLAPVLAPLAGGQLLHVTDWRGTFVVLTAIGVVLLGAGVALLPETLAPDQRRAGGLRSTLHVLRRLAGDRAFVGLALCMALAFGALCVYLGGSSFVLEDVHGLSPQLYSLVFAINAAGIVMASQVSRRLVDRLGSLRLLELGVGCAALGGAGTLAAVATGAPLGVLLVSLFLVVASVGLVRPNAMALALAPHPESAGTAAGLMGVTMFGIGALLLPIAGVGGSHDALPMAIAMCATALAAPVALAVGVRRRRGAAA